MPTDTSPPRVAIGPDLDEGTVVLELLIPEVPWASRATILSPDEARDAATTLFQAAARADGAPAADHQLEAGARLIGVDVDAVRALAAEVIVTYRDLLMRAIEVVAARGGDGGAAPRRPRRANRRGCRRAGRRDP